MDAVDALPSCGAGQGILENHPWCVSVADPGCDARLQAIETVRSWQQGYTPVQSMRGLKIGIPFLGTRSGHSWAGRDGTSMEAPPRKTTSTHTGLQDLEVRLEQPSSSGHRGRASALIPVVQPWTAWWRTTWRKAL